MTPVNPFNGLLTQCFTYALGFKGLPGVWKSLLNTTVLLLEDFLGWVIPQGSEMPGGFGLVFKLLFFPSRNSNFLKKNLKLLAEILVLEIRCQS